MNYISRTLLKTICLAIFLLFIQNAYSQIDTVLSPGKWSIGASVHRGFIIAHRSAIVHLQDRHPSELELSYLKTADGSKEWHHNYNHPQYGLGYKFFDFGNDRELGYGHSLFGQIIYPMIKKNRLRLGLKLGVGVGYVEKPFNSIDNYKNLAIGSNLNGYVNTGIQFRFLSKNKLQFNAGIDFAHFSNGSIRKPNLGINLPSINFGVIYFPGEALLNNTAFEKSPKRKAHFSGITAFAIKDLFPPGGPRYFVNILHLHYDHPIKKKGFLGGGLEFILDRSLYKQLEDEKLPNNKLIDVLRSGIFVSAGINMGPWDGFLQVGTYTYDQLKLDGNIYNRLLLRYAFSKHVFTSLGLKSHYGRADYFEFGIGYKL